MMRKNEFTLPELIMAVTVVMLQFVLIASLCGEASHGEGKLLCENHLKNLGNGAASYSTDQNGYFMPGGVAGKNTDQPFETWATLLGCSQRGNYVKAENFNCPNMMIYLPERWHNAKELSSTQNWIWHKPAYGYNTAFPGGERRAGNIIRSQPYSIAAIDNPANLLMMADSADEVRKYGSFRINFVYATDGSVLWPRHDGAVNVLFADGHVHATSSGLAGGGNDASKKLYESGQELESAATQNKDECKWRCGLD